MSTEPQRLVDQLLSSEHRAQALAQFERSIQLRMQEPLAEEDLVLFSDLFAEEMTVLRTLHSLELELYHEALARAIERHEDLQKTPLTQLTHTVLNFLYMCDLTDGDFFFCQGSDSWSRGRVHEDQGELEEALIDYLVGRSWVMALPVHPAHVTVLADLEAGIGNIYRSLRQFERSLAAYERGLKLNLGEEPDTRAILENNYGVTLRHVGRTEEAIAAFERARELWSLGPRDSQHLRWLSSAEGNLGVAYSQMGDRHRALSRQRRDAALMEELYALEPNLEHLDSLAGSLTNLGNELRAQGMLEEGLEANKRARDLLAGIDLGSYDLRERMASFEMNYANALTMVDRNEEAVNAYRAAILIWRELAAEGRPGVLLELGFTQSNLAMAFSDLEQPERALEFQHEALKNIESANPQGRRRYHLGTVYRNVGYLQDVAGRFPEAKTAYLKAREIWEKLIELQPSVRSELATLEHNLAWVLGELEEPKEAREAAEKALEHLNLLISDQGRLDLKEDRTDILNILAELDRQGY